MPITGHKVSNEVSNQSILSFSPTLKAPVGTKKELKLS